MAVGKSVWPGLEPGHRTLKANGEAGHLLWNLPKKRREQANLVWCFDDGHMIKLGFEIENGVANIIMGRKENN